MSWGERKVLCCAGGGSRGIAGRPGALLFLFMSVGGGWKGEWLGWEGKSVAQGFEPAQTWCMRILFPALFCLASVLGAVSWAGDLHKYPRYDEEGLCMDYRIPYCASSRCHWPDSYGGFGTEVSRTYSLVYARDEKVCGAIRDALNGAVAGHRQHTGKVAQNPLFAAPVFLEWKEFSLPEVVDPSRNENLFTVALLNGWVVVPYRNDGHPRLVVRQSPSSAFREFCYAPPSVVKVMDVPEKDLSQKNWNDFRSYNDYAFAEAPYGKDRPDILLNDMDIVRLIDPPRKSGADVGKVNYAPRLPGEVSAADRALWAKFSRPTATVEFARVDGQYYTVLVDGTYDLMVVADAGRPAGEDVCYLQSDINRRIRVPR